MFKTVYEWAPALEDEIRRGRKKPFHYMLFEFARVIATEARRTRDARIQQLENALRKRQRPE
jgi:hypothetical protein